jgi:HTH-type transcriptional regulator/antitoxin HigA
MNIKNIPQIVTKNDYEKAISYLEKLMSKGEKDMTGEETDLLTKAAALAAAYEEQRKITPVPRNKKLEAEHDTQKIAQVLGYEPDLIELVEFKMYQMKMNQNSLAEILKMPASKISQILNKKREPDISFLKGIHEKLGIDGNYILEAL